MISPHTPPGTKVICFRIGTVHPAFYASDAITLGAEYTVKEILPCKGWSWSTPTGFVAVIDELDRGRGFCLSMFRLPVTLDSLKALSCESPDHLDKGAPSPRKRVRA